MRESDFFVFYKLDPKDKDVVKRHHINYEHSFFA